MDAAILFSIFGSSLLAFLVIVFLALLFSSYIKIVTVLSIVRVGLGAGSFPSAFVVGGLSMALAFFVMYPTIVDSTQAMDKVFQSRSAGQSWSGATDQVRAAALGSALDRWKLFLQAHAGKQEVDRFVDAAKRLDQGQTAAGVKTGADAAEVRSDSWRVLAPAFLVSELKAAFSTGLSLFLPFLIVDLLAATALAAIGLERLNPVLVALPIKLLLFVAVDGWSLITTNLVSTYH